MLNLKQDNWEGNPRKLSTSNQDLNAKQVCTLAFIAFD